MRLCPKCGQKSEDLRCPKDGTATLSLTANPESRLAEGTEINGRYRIRNMIGQGGFGAVYRATNIATDQDIAIKLLAVSLDSDDSDQIQRFFAEAQVTAALKHPNTIRVFDFGQTEGGALYIAMELLSGRPLNEVLKRRLAEGRVMSEEETVTVGTQALRSLAEAHSAKLVHRDLKPHNVFVHEAEGDDLVVKVLDFGIAKRLGSNLTGTGKAFGTPTYMSPEQAQNQQIDHRSDLYSLACVLYQCVAGHPPFEGEDPLAVLLAHVTKSAPDLHVSAKTPVSDAFVAVLAKAMAKDPADRYATAIEFRQALDQTRGRGRTELGRSVLPSAAELAAKPVELSPSTAPSGRAVAQTLGYGKAGPDDGTAVYATPMTGAAPGAVAPRPVSSVRSAAQTGEDDGQLPASSTGNRKLFAVAAAVALAVGVAGVLAWGPKDADEPKAAIQSEVAAAPAPAPQLPPKSDEPAPAKAEADAQVAAADIAVAAPELGPVDVSLESDPPGASIVVGTEAVGKTPFSIRIPGGGKVTAVLRLPGHRELEVNVDAADVPRKLVKLSPVPVAERASGGIRKSGGGQSGQTVKKGGGVDLDERLP